MTPQGCLPLQKVSRYPLHEILPSTLHQITIIKSSNLIIKCSNQKMNYHFFLLLSYQIFDSLYNKILQSLGKKINKATHKYFQLQSNQIKAEICMRNMFYCTFRRINLLKTNKLKNRRRKKLREIGYKNELRKANLLILCCEIINLISVTLIGALNFIISVFSQQQLLCYFVIRLSIALETTKKHHIN